MNIITRIDTDQGRFYETPGGKFPSVNTILDATMPPEDKARLERWRLKNQDLPKQEGEISAAERGSLMHEAIANYFEDRTLINPELHPTVEPYWKSIKPWLIKAGEPATVTFSGSPNNSLPSIELPVYHSQLKYAGTLDWVGYWEDDILSLVDFKSSGKMKKKSWMTRARLQCAAYKLAFESLFDLKIENIVIPVALPNKIAQVFELNPQEIQEDTEQWLDRLNQFQV